MAARYSCRIFPSPAPRRVAAPGWEIFGLASRHRSPANFFGASVGFYEGPFDQVVVSRQGQQRPTVPIHVVLQIKNARKTGAGGFGFRPGPVGVLRLDQVTDAADHTGAMGIVEGAQAHDCPGGLRSGAGTLAFENGIVVGVAPFAPTA